MADSTPSEAEGEQSSGGQPTSLTLLAKVRGDEPNGWSRLNHLYGPLIWYWCRKWGVVADHAEDVRQEVYRVLFERVGEFRRERVGSFRSWLRAITQTLIRAHLRTLAREPRAEGGTDAGRRFQEVPAPAAEDEEDDPEEERAALLHRALELIGKELSKRDQQLLSFLVMDRLAIAEVAGRLRMTPAAVRTAKSRLLRRLKDEAGEV